MGLMTILTRMDERVVPRLARGLGRAIDTGRAHKPRPLTVAAIVLVLAVGATGAWRLNRSPGGHDDGTSTVRVGVRDGDSVPVYISASNAKLGMLVSQSPDRPIYALVSFIRYLNPDEVAAVVNSEPKGSVAPVLWYGRVPLPRRQTQIVTRPAGTVPSDIVTEMMAIANRKAEDAASYRHLAATEPNPSVKAVWSSNADVSQQEAAAYRMLCSCVYSLVIRATPATLSQLAHQPDVRVVDPVPDISNSGDATFNAPLPEQADIVVPLPDDALPPATHS
jgi:hypothetical protein